MVVVDRGSEHDPAGVLALAVAGRSVGEHQVAVGAAVGPVAEVRHHRPRHSGREPLPDVVAERNQLGTGDRDVEPDDGAGPCESLGDRVSQVPRPVGRDQDGVIHHAGVVERRHRVGEHLRGADGAGRLDQHRHLGGGPPVTPRRAEAVDVVHRQVQGRVRDDLVGRQQRPERILQDPQRVQCRGGVDRGQQAARRLPGDSGQLDRHPGNDAERPARTHHQRGQARSGVVLAQPRQVVDHGWTGPVGQLDVGQDRLDAEHPAAHVAVRQHPGPAGVGRHHRSQARIGPQVDRQRQAQRSQPVVQRREPHPGRDDRHPVIREDLDRVDQSLGAEDHDRSRIGSRRNGRWHRRADQARVGALGQQTEPVEHGASDDRAHLCGRRRPQHRRGGTAPAAGGLQVAVEDVPARSQHRPRSERVLEVVEQPVVEQPVVEGCRGLAVGLLHVATT